MLSQLESIKLLWQDLMPKEKAFPPTFLAKKADRQSYHELLQAAVMSDCHDYRTLGTLIFLAPPVLEINIQDDCDPSGASLLCSAIKQSLDVNVDRIDHYANKVQFLLNMGALFTAPNDSAIRLVNDSDALINKLHIYRALLSVYTNIDYSIEVREVEAKDYRNILKFYLNASPRKKLTITGLSKKTEYNHCDAELLSYNEEKNRYAVKVTCKDNSTATMLVKPANINGINEPLVWRLEGVASHEVSIKATWRALLSFNVVVPEVYTKLKRAHQPDKSLVCSMEGVAVDNAALTELMLKLPAFHTEQTNKFPDWGTQITTKIKAFSEKIPEYLSWCNRQASRSTKEACPLEEYIEIFNDYLVLIEQCSVGISPQQLMMFFIKGLWPTFYEAAKVSYSSPKGFSWHLFTMLEHLDKTLFALEETKKIIIPFKFHSDYAFIRATNYIHHYFLHRFKSNSTLSVSQTYDPGYAHQLLVRFFESETNDDEMRHLIAYIYLLKHQLMDRPDLKLIFSCLESILDLLSHLVEQPTTAIETGSPGCDIFVVSAEINIICKFIEIQYHADLDETEFDTFVTYINSALIKTNAFLKKLGGYFKKQFDIELSINLILKENQANIMRLKQQLEAKKRATRSTPKKSSKKPAAARMKAALKSEATLGVDVTRQVEPSNEFSSNAVIEGPTLTKSIEKPPIASKALTKTEPAPNSIKPVDTVKRISAKQKSAEKSAKRAAYYARIATDDDAGPAEAAGGGSRMLPERNRYPLRYPLKSNIEYFITISSGSIPDSNIMSYVRHFLSNEPRMGSYGNCVKPVSRQECKKNGLADSTCYKIKITDANLPGKSMRMFGHVKKEPHSDPHQVNIVFADKITIGGNRTHR
jgi:hypothetical protein